MRLFMVTVMLVAFVGLSAGCGKKLDSAQSADVGNVLSGLKSGMPGGYGVAARDATPSRTLAGRINGMVSGAIWLQRFKIAAGDFSGVRLAHQDSLSPWEGSSCPTSESDLAGMGCTVTCPSGSALKVACESSETTRMTCNSVNYSFSDLTIALTMDLGGVTQSGSSVSGSMILGIDMSTTVTGGALTGGTLACNITMEFNLGATSATDLQPTCGDNFNCTYNGASASCDDLATVFGSNSTACTETS